jgi:hypothetical protein
MLPLDVEAASDCSGRRSKHRNLSPKNSVSHGRRVTPYQQFAGRFTRGHAADLQWRSNFQIGGADIKDLGGLSADALSGAFDEPLSKDKVRAIAKMFIKAA